MGTSVYELRKAGAEIKQLADLLRVLKVEVKGLTAQKRKDQMKRIDFLVGNLKYLRAKRREMLEAPWDEDRARQKRKQLDEQAVRR